MSKKEELFEKIDVPQDGDSLFWSVTLAYLIPVKDDDELFKERYEKLFGDTNSNELNGVQCCIKDNCNPPNLNRFYGDETLKNLVTEIFRGRVVDNEVRSGKKITVYDIYKGKNSINDFVGQFSKKYSPFIKKYKIDVGELKLANKDELDKIDKNATKNLKKLISEMYLKCMKQAGSYGGEHEIVAMKEILESSVYVLSQDSKKRRYTGHNDQINLFLNGEKHYNFGLIKVKELATAIEKENGRHYFKQAVKLLLDKGVGASIKNHRDKTVVEFVKSFPDENSILELLNKFRRNTAAKKLERDHAKNARKRQAIKFKEETSSGVNTTPYTDTSGEDSALNPAKRTKLDSVTDEQFTSTPNGPIPSRFFASDLELSNAESSHPEAEQSGTSNQEDQMEVDSDIPAASETQMMHKQYQTELLVNVPGDGSCLFWSVALAYLIPVRGNNELFKERYEKLFGNAGSEELQCVQSCIKNISFDGKLDLGDIGKRNPTLERLVTETFRKKVADTVYEKQRNLDYANRTITAHSIFASMNEEYISGFVGDFRNRFQNEISEYKIDIEKLESHSMHIVENELNRTNEFPADKRYELSDVILESYKKCLSEPKSWGGEYEMNAMEDLLMCRIWVSEGKDVQKYVRVPSTTVCNYELRGGYLPDSGIRIELVCCDMSHYNFKLDKETLKWKENIFSPFEGKDSEINSLDKSSNSQQSRRSERERKSVNYGERGRSGDDHNSSGSEYKLSESSDSQSSLKERDSTSQPFLDDSLRSKLNNNSIVFQEASSSAKEVNGQIVETKRWYELLERKIGLDINARELIETNPELASINKSELIVRLAYELCLAKNTEYDPKNDAIENEEESNKYRTFDTRRIFALFEVLNDKMDKSDRKSFVEFVCKKGNVQLLEKICQQEKGKGVIKGIACQYSWGGDFTGYPKLIDLLQYVIIKQPCSPKIVSCIAEKVYGTAHYVYNGKQYLDKSQTGSIRASFKQQILVMEECLKKAIELGYKDAALVMLGGDIYHCIRLVKKKRFEKEQKFDKAYNMIKQAVVDIISSWITDEDRKQSLQGLLDQGIEIDISKMSKEDIINELENQGIEVSTTDKKSKNKLMKKLKEVGQVGKLELRRVVVGTLISVLFFNYQDVVMKAAEHKVIKQFTLEIISQEKSRKGNKCNELNDKNKSVEDIVSELIKSLNENTHIRYGWFFREVLAAIVNDREKLGKLKAVCTATCKEPMQALLKGKKVHKDIIDVLKFIGVEISPSQITTSEIPNSCLKSSIDVHFAKDIQKLAEKVKTEGEISLFKEKTREIFSYVSKLGERKESGRRSLLAFSGLSRNIIITLKEKKKFKKGLVDNEKKELSDAVSQAMFEIEKGINILADKDNVSSKARIDTDDIFEHFKFINDEITREKRKEIVELVCQKGNVQLLEKICQQEKGKGVKKGIVCQYPWKGDFTGCSELIGLLQYVIIKQSCSPEIVLSIAKKVYGTAHHVYNGKQYLDESQVQLIKAGYGPSSAIKMCLKTAIELGYKNVVLVMLGGDIYHCIRLMKKKRFKENKKFLEAYNTVEETVADVISSWVTDEDRKQSLQGLLDQGVEIDMNKMEREDFMNELEDLGIEISAMEKRFTTKNQLIVKLKKEVGQVGKLRLRQTVVGALISVLFFNHQGVVMKVAEGNNETKQFTSEITQQSEFGKRSKCNELNDKNTPVKDIVLEFIKLLNSSTHIKYGWFFREVLVEIVNDKEKLGKLKAVCTAICKEPMQKLVNELRKEGKAINEKVTDVLKFIGVEKDSLVLDKSMDRGNSSALISSLDNVNEKVEDGGSFVHQTKRGNYEYKLKSSDIRDIVESAYGWITHRNKKGVMNTAKGVFFTCSDTQYLEQGLKEYEEKIKENSNLIFTSILNLNENHWVTLVVAHNTKDKKFIAYYCDSFDSTLPSEISKALEETLGINNNHIKSSKVQQQSDEYNCGIFALINAEKISRMIKSGSFTEINVDELTTEQLTDKRKEFAEKVKDRFKSNKENIDNKCEGESYSGSIEVMQDECSVEDRSTLLSQQLSATKLTIDNRSMSISRDSEKISTPLSLPKQSIEPKKTQPKITKFLNSPSSRVAEKNNEDVMQNNCGQNQSFYQNKGKVPMIASSSNVLNKGDKMLKGKKWSKSQAKSNVLLPERKAINFTMPPIAEFKNKFYETYKNKLLENYVLSYDTLNFFSSGSESDSFSSERMDFNATVNSEMVLDSQQEVSYAVSTYDEAITSLRNGELEYAIKELEELANQGMPHAQYAYAVVIFRDVLKSKGTRQDFECFKAIRYLFGSETRCNFHPFNTFVLAMIQLYDIGGYGRAVNQVTGLNAVELLYEVLHATKNINVNPRKLVDSGKLITPGELIEGDEKINELACIVRCAQYEIVRDKLSQHNPHREHSLIDEIFCKLSTELPEGKIPFRGVFRYGHAEMQFRYAVELLDEKAVSDEDKEKAIQLLNKAFVNGKHKGAVFLLGTLPFRSKFNFLVGRERLNEAKKYFKLLEDYAQEHRDEVAACMVANEYLMDSGHIKKRDLKRAEDVLRESGCEHIWEEFCTGASSRLANEQQSQNSISALTQSSQKAGASLYLQQEPYLSWLKKIPLDELGNISRNQLRGPNADQALEIITKIDEALFDKQGQCAFNEKKECTLDELGNISARQRRSYNDQQKEILNMCGKLSDLTFTQHNLTSVSDITNTTVDSGRRRVCTPPSDIKQFDNPVLNSSKKSSKSQIRDEQPDLENSMSQFFLDKNKDGESVNEDTGYLSNAKSTVGSDPSTKMVNVRCEAKKKANQI